MDLEKVDVLDNHGKLTGEIMLKTEAHKKGVWHRAVHIWVYNSKGELLLQKRAKKKKYYPGLWDISAAGHVSAGQSYQEAAQRELFEELGIMCHAKALKPIKLWKLKQDLSKPFLKNREFVKGYSLRWDGNVASLRLQEEEVEQAKLMPIDDFESNIMNDEKSLTYVPQRKYYLEGIALLKKEMGR
ncbi:NUDIX domain-containing protein [Candidatus Woesearchaeota archaeon]|nr:NUDIX domain-containing protein [Candidatus Woesearchaeota archaeon]